MLESARSRIDVRQDTKNGRETTIEVVSLCRIAVWRKSSCLIIRAVLNAYRTGRNQKRCDIFSLLNFNQSVILINCTSQLMGVWMFDRNRLMFVLRLLKRNRFAISVDIWAHRRQKKSDFKGSSGKALINPLMTLFPPFRLPFSSLVVSDRDTPICLASSLAD